MVYFPPCISPMVLEKKNVWKFSDRETALIGTIRFQPKNGKLLNYYCNNISDQVMVFIASCMYE